MKYGRSALFGEIAGAAAVFVLILVVVLFGLGNTDQSVKDNGRKTAEDAVRRAAVSCYALEGSYPESYDYLKKHYAVAVNEQLYIVNYSVFGANIMPDITVIER